MSVELKTFYYDRMPTSFKRRCNRSYNAASETWKDMQIQGFSERWANSNRQKILKQIPISWAKLLVDRKNKVELLGNLVERIIKDDQTGYMIGNPLTDKTNDFNSRVQFAHRLALLSDELFKVRN
ncbi:hypothetical protein LguiB_024079 [Lonicera macranthoides]